MVLELNNPLFYVDGKSGSGNVSAIVGNDWNSEYSRVKNRTVRYTFTAPPEGARGVLLTFRTSGKHDGKHIPIRFFIGEDPDSHAAADGTYEYTGELTLGEDYLTFTGAADMLLIPGKTYYLWVFPGSKDYGHYTWERAGYVSTMEFTGAGCACCVMHNGEPWIGVLNVVHDRSFWVCAGYAVENGALYYVGAPNGGT